MARMRLYKPILHLSMVIASGFSTTLMTTAVVTTWSKPAEALEYTDKDLMLKDFEQMSDLLNVVNKGDFGTDDVEESRHLKARASLFLVLARRDRDGSRGQLVHNVQSDIDDDYFSVVTEVGQIALKSVGDTKLSVDQRSTYLMVLENICSEFRPQAKDKLKPLFIQIRDANLDPDDDVVRYRMLKMMEGTANPSKIAGEILKRI